MKQIVEGIYNSIKGKNKDISKRRLEICKNCPLYLLDNMLGPICNPALYINKKGEVSRSSEQGFEKGCGCVLNWKTKVPDAKCIIKKW